jgi:hypothetical protein
MNTFVFQYLNSIDVEMTNLKRLDLSRTHVTDEGVGLLTSTIYFHFSLSEIDVTLN